LLSALTLARRAATLPGPLHPEAVDAISFDSGFASPGIFPDLTRAAERALTTYRREALQYCLPFGLAALREWIAAYMRDDGVDVDVEDVMIVNGAKNGLDLICRLFAEEGDAVVVTAPMYFTAIPILRSFGLSFIEIPQDREGLDVKQLELRLQQRERDGLPPPKFIYDVTDFHNPTGITMSLDRRQALLRLAGDRSIPIVEDSPYRKLRFEGEAVPSLKALDRNGMVFAVGTFSKLIAPGLRIGWIGADRSMLRRIAQLKSDGGTCPLTQRIVLEFFKDDGLTQQLVRARTAYAAHRDHMVAALRRELPDVAFSAPHGGYYLWLKLPDGIDSGVLAHRAFEMGVSVIPGDAFFASNEPGSARSKGVPKHHLRLAYSYSTEQEIDEGVNRLSKAYHSLLS
jgi:2-aminoadipate transaminase